MGTVLLLCATAEIGAIWLARPETRNAPTTILVVLIMLSPAQRSPKRHPTVLGGKAGRHPCGILPRTCNLSSEPAGQHGQIQHAPCLASEARVYRTIAPAPFGRDVVKNHGEVIGRLAWLSKAARHPPIVKRAPIAEESAFSARIECVGIGSGNVSGGGRRIHLGVRKLAYRSAQALRLARPVQGALHPELAGRR